MSRFVCTPERPWKKEDGFPVSHTNAREIGEQESGYPGGDIVHMQCVDCGAEWTLELPQ